MGQDRVHEPPSRFQLPVCFPPSCSYTGGPSSSCEMIILRNKIISQLSPQFPHNKSYYLGLSTWQHQKRPLTDSFRLYEALLPATRNQTLSATPIISEGVWSYLFSSRRYGIFLHEDGNKKVSHPTDWQHQGKNWWQSTWLENPFGKNISKNTLIGCNPQCPVSYHHKKIDISFIQFYVPSVVRTVVKPQDSWSTHSWLWQASKVATNNIHMKKKEFYCTPLGFSFVELVFKSFTNLSPN